MPWSLSFHAGPQGSFPSTTAHPFALANEVSMPLQFSLPLSSFNKLYLPRYPLPRLFFRFLLSASISDRR